MIVDNNAISIRMIAAKRKSAVELLQETKPLYVKSEIVLDRKQELRRSLRGYQLPNCGDEDVEELLIGDGGCIGRSNTSASPPPCSLSSNATTNSNSTTCYNNASQNNSSTANGWYCFSDSLGYAIVN